MKIKNCFVSHFFTHDVKSVDKMKRYLIYCNRVQKRVSRAICPSMGSCVSIANHMKHYRFSVVVECDKDGYFIFCPELQGCYSQGVPTKKRFGTSRMPFGST